MATPRRGDALFIRYLGRAAATRMGFSLIFLRDLVLDVRKALLLLFPGCTVATVTYIIIIIIIYNIKIIIIYYRHTAYIDI